MNLHEYQAKALLAKYGISVPAYELILHLDDLEPALKAMGTEEVVIKAQIHAGGRGKAGGVKLAKNGKEAKALAKEMMGMRIVNEQTGKEGVLVEKLIISPIARFVKEYYIGAVIDRKSAKAVLIASKEGGVDIEVTAKERPEAILKCPIPLDGHFKPYQLWEIVKFMGWEGNLRKAGMELAARLAKAFTELDASLLEINPLVALEDGSLLALDAKLSIDDNALFRHQDIAEAFDASQISPFESIAREFDLAYVALDGEIGCMVNGAGLAMATMDIIEYYGGRPANFLDVGGGASREKIAKGFEIIMSDPKVKVIFVNIFGGIMNCETLAEGIILAGKDLNCPLIVRMEGTHVEEGKAKLKASTLKIQLAESLDEGAKLAVECARS